MKTKDSILEQDLWKPVRDFLIEKGYVVRSEVKDCDIVAMKDEVMTVVELKKNLSVGLLAQVVKRQKFADLVYAAVPKPKKIIGSAKWRDICHLLRRLELGLILVSFKGSKGFVEVAVEPSFFDRERSRQRNKKIRENIIQEMKGRYEDFNIGGSTGKKVITAYRESSIFIACCLEKLGPLSPKKLRELGTDLKKTTSILYENHYGWFEKVERGIYSISDTGKQALNIYKELSDYYFDKLNNKEIE